MSYWSLSFLLVFTGVFVWLFVKTRPPEFISYPFILVLWLEFFAIGLSFGEGRIWNQMNGFEILLNHGVEYKLLSSTPDGDSQILLVKEILQDGEGTIYSFRSEVVPPKNFTLIDDKPISIMATSAR